MLIYRFLSYRILFCFLDGRRRCLVDVVEDVDEFLDFEFFEFWFSELLILKRCCFIVDRMVFFKSLVKKNRVN